MKRVLLSLIVLICSYNAYSVNVTGNAFLDNTIDHSGIEVRFNPESASAQFVSCSTLSTGEFSASIQPGIYSIEYYKETYQLYSINEPKLIIEDCSLGDVTLLSKPLLDVSGNVSGNWTNDFTYNVIANITVPNGSTLSIEEGTIVQFAGKYKMDVIGKLKALGTETEKITFTSAKVNKSAGDWDGIFIRGNETSIISYSILEYGGSEENCTGIVTVIGKSKISNCIITNSERSGILITGDGYAEITNNSVSTMSRGIVCDQSASADISFNNLTDCSFYGIASTNDKAYIFKNIAHHCGSGILCEGNIVIEYNIFYGNDNGIRTRYCETPTFKNNTFLNNTNGILLYNYDELEPDISNNIFIGNKYAINRPTYYIGDPKKIEYNLFYNNSVIYNGSLLGFGLQVTKNINGTNCDVYLNLFDDPSLVTTNPNDERFVELLPSSICINAGNPSFLDVDGTTIDIGAKVFNSFSTDIEKTESKVGCSMIIYDTKSNDLILKLVNDSDYLVDIYNLSGEKMSSFYIYGALNHRINIADFNSGIYIVKVYNRHNSSSCTSKIYKN